MPRHEIRESATARNALTGSENMRGPHFVLIALSLQPKKSRSCSHHFRFPFSDLKIWTRGRGRGASWALRPLRSVWAATPRWVRLQFRGASPQSEVRRRERSFKAVRAPWRDLYSTRTPLMALWTPSRLLHFSIPPAAPPLPPVPQWLPTPTRHPQANLFCPPGMCWTRAMRWMWG